jgi:hypothetical protein
MTVEAYSDSFWVQRFVLGSKFFRINKGPVKNESL